jgi:hypothetical protein
MDWQGCHSKVSLIAEHPIICMIVIGNSRSGHHFLKFMIIPGDVLTSMLACWDIWRSYVVWSKRFGEFVVFRLSKL